MVTTHAIVMSSYIIGECMMSLRVRMMMVMRIVLISSSIYASMPYNSRQSMIVMLMAYPIMMVVQSTVHAAMLLMVAPHTRLPLSMLLEYYHSSLMLHSRVMMMVMVL